MKSSSSMVLAALLLLLSIACNQKTGRPMKEKSVKTEELDESSLSREVTPSPTVGHARQSQDLKKMKSPEVAGKRPDPAAADHEMNTEDYDHIEENRFLSSLQNPLSTFSIDVDEASYSNIRRYITGGALPPAGAVRIEEMINYFHYHYPQPVGQDPFSVNTEIASCPWNPAHQLALIGLQGKQIPVDQLPNANLVFLIDVSGSMDEPAKLPLVKLSLKMLTDQLRENDKVAIVVYAGNAGLVLPSTSGSQKNKIKDAIDNLEAGGSTAGGQGLELAYKIAGENFIKGGNNRIVLSTDGDFNVGPSSDDELVSLVEKERNTGVYLSVLGYGMGNYKDNKMEQLADKGNGNHAYIDNANEARKVLVEEFGGTLFTIAKDVKIQVEFNPAKVQSYRLIGYENRALAAEDFNNDQKDAGELGSGHTVTALYEIIPAGVKDEFSHSVDDLKYQSNRSTLALSSSDEWMTVKLRYKRPDEEASRLITKTIIFSGRSTVTASENLRWASAVAEFGLLLRNSAFKEKASWQQISALANDAKGEDAGGYRVEFVRLVQTASSLALAKK
jgi:Ca-activated chloride channel homolog